MIVWILVAVLALYLILTYNSLVNIKNNVEKAWANIDVLLKQRNDELPKLIDTCKVYMSHEAQTLEKVTQARLGVDAARQSHDITHLSQAEVGLRASLGSLFAVVENYPELKADQTFLNLQGRITGLENQIADRREFYNDAVAINNVRIRQFPDLIVAGLFNFGRADMIRFASAELQDIDVASRFKA